MNRCWRDFTALEPGFVSSIKYRIVQIPNNIIWSKCHICPQKNGHISMDEAGKFFLLELQHKLLVLTFQIHDLEDFQFFIYITMQSIY